ncbi:hypothetical protein [Azospirillum picis]|uniref:Uncharacterized protein n=1 Tax=Azospirillum picis TaxID=488438 RepID=A0ABU0MMG4_9PROT|nr:hypothetical protein [Azospirillum picis]MBP2300699.1 hypothetical protein [Azospirillum picis]MDQ0534668.1 hypothetical protein [Azospirillum picis]
MNVTVIFQQPEDPYMLGRISMPDYSSAACYIMQHLPTSARSSAIIEDQAGHRSTQPHIQMHYELLAARHARRAGH